MTVHLAASLLFVTISACQTADKPKEAPLAPERMLHGRWKGGPCQGTWTFRADGTFETQHYTPGNYKLAGAWELRWTALPPTLVLACKTSDYPDLVGKTWEVKLIQLDDDALAYQYLSEVQHPGGHTDRFKRVNK